jgi:S1-C subfamily serine protease
MAFLDELQSNFASVAGKVAPSVVRLGGWRGGSGVVIGDNAILTNAHNVRGDETTVTFADGREAQATLSGIDVDGDLAVLAVDTAGAATIEWSDEQPTIGSAAFVVTTSGGTARVTFGYVSSVARAFRGPRGRRISGSVEHTAPLAPGSSGSPLVDRNGRLLGLNTNRVGNGFYLALPADESLRTRVTALQRGDSAERPHLGVGIAPSWIANRMRASVGLPERSGVLVRDVEEGSPAQAGGIREGDLIVEAGGHEIAEPDDVYDALATVAANGGLQVKLVRGADEMTVEVSFAAGSDGSSDAGGPIH